LIVVVVAFWPMLAAPATTAPPVGCALGDSCAAAGSGAASSTAAAATDCNAVLAHRRCPRLIRPRITSC
jgi:tetrahydromethanopterin S-methyltransferase subunit D